MVRCNSAAMILTLHVTSAAVTSAADIIAGTPPWQYKFATAEMMVLPHAIVSASHSQHSEHSYSIWHSKHSYIIWHLCEPQGNSDCISSS